jgi:hypothetical protein
VKCDCSVVRISDVIDETVRATECAARLIIDVNMVAEHVGDPRERKHQNCSDKILVYFVELQTLSGSRYDANALRGWAVEQIFPIVS